MRGVVLVLVLAGCGRIGYEPRIEVDAAPIDATPIDAPPVCPPDMTELAEGSSTCIDLADRGAFPWTVGKTMCAEQGRRYCTDAEWVLACTNATGLIEMTLDDYEWVAEEDAGVAQKRGASGCSDSSSHVIVDPYEVRCCGPKI